MKALSFVMKDVSWIIEQRYILAKKFLPLANLYHSLSLPRKANALLFLPILRLQNYLHTEYRLDTKVEVSQVNVHYHGNHFFPRL